MGKLKPCNAEDYDTKRLCKDRYECARFAKNKQEHTSISFYHLQEHCNSFKRKDDSEEVNYKWESFTDKLNRLKAMWNFLVQKNNAVMKK
jgi:hypothetical protein